MKDTPVTRTDNENTSLIARAVEIAKMYKHEMDWDKDEAPMFMAEPIAALLAVSALEGNLSAKEMAFTLFQSIPMHTEYMIAEIRRAVLDGD
jgi:hypothetical protein